MDRFARRMPRFLADALTCAIKGTTRGLSVAYRTNEKMHKIDELSTHEISEEADMMWKKLEILLETKPPPRIGRRPHRRVVRDVLVAVAIVVTTLIGGCNTLAPRARDENTIASIERTIKARRDDFGRLESELIACRDVAIATRAQLEAVRKIASDLGAKELPPLPGVNLISDQILKGLRAMNEAELDRLNRLLEREKAKMDAGDTQ